MHKVAVLLLEPVIGFDAAIAPLVFGSAESDAGEPLYEVTVCSVDGGPVQTWTGYGILPGAGLDAVAAADTVVVPGTRHPAVRERGEVPAEVLAALGSGKRYVSICTGAYLLAAAGLLDGRPATTHWRQAADLAARHPAVRMDSDVLFVDDGDVLTSAGLAAGLDLCLHIVRRDHGAAVANRVARYIVVPPWRDGGQAQFIERPVPVADAASTAGAREWALGRLAEPLSVAELARRVHMSERTFARRFREETGQSPAAWLRRQRVDAALNLLETADTGVDEIAAHVGLGTGTNLRQHMRRDLGVSPLQYRRRFRGT